MSLVVLTAPAPLVDLDRFLDATAEGCRASPLFLWDAEGAPFGLAGRGEAVRIEGRGEGRFRQVVERARRSFADLVDHRLPGAEDAPAPALFGGLAFHPMPVWEEPWTGFGDASFVLPRWSYVRGGRTGRAFLRLGLRSADLPWIHGWLAALAEILGDLAETAPAEAAGGERSDGAAELVQMTEEVWSGLVSDALGRISARRLRKIVAARRSQVTAAAPIDVLGVLARLRRSGGQGCVRFAFQREAATFLGQTPERLVSLSGRDVTTEAIAGSATGPDAGAILERPKERWEHAVVVDGIRRALGPICDGLEIPDEPGVRALPGIHHLCTPIHGTLKEPLHVLDLARKLHPTPAVSGAPGRPATRWIVQHEPHARGWYAGPVGWFDPGGNGELAVAIRSGVIMRRRAWIWAGAGIVAGSDPESEYAETGAKQAPLLHALGLAA
ncbi:MAG: isochorismate synthase [Deltaproteobacteria bacterium]|nr:isochorismate synthase [Deltaproteobacteria bacterium]